MGITIFSYNFYETIYIYINKGDQSSSKTWLFSHVYVVLLVSHILGHYNKKSLGGGPQMLARGFNSELNGSHGP